MSRIVLTTIGSLGDLYPLVAIGLELQQRGHQVVFATGKYYREMVETLGFEFRLMRPEQIAPDDQATIAQMMDTRQGTERLLRDYIFTNVRDTYTDLLAIAEGADFIVAGELVYAARSVAEKLGIRWAFCALQPLTFLSAYDPPVISTFPAFAMLRTLGPIVNQVISIGGHWVTRSWVEPLHQLRRELGLPAVGNPLIEAKFSPHLVLALFSPLLGSPQPDWPANTVQTGFTFYDGEPIGKSLGDRSTGFTPELQQFLAAGEPPIVFTLGSAAVLAPGDFYEQSIRAVQTLGQRAVLLTGITNTPPQNLPNTIIAIPYAPHSQIFLAARAIVHQGGIGTTAKALRSGRPTLVVPYSHDQPDNAARVERLGTSRTIARQDYTVDRAATELHTLLTTTRYAHNADAVAQVVQAEDGARVAAEAIEQQLGAGLVGSDRES